MKASAIEFRLRMPINAAIIVLGFWAPWIDAWGIGNRISLLEWLALEISRTGLLRFTVATPVVILTSALIAGVAAVLRVWGTAYLGSFTVHSLGMKAVGVIADGPYRFVRNPLYLGLWAMTAALAFLMPPTGALVTMTLLTVFLLRLILAEEGYLSARLGEPYRAYLQSVPRLVPLLRSSIAHGSSKPDWLRGVLTELLSIGVFITLAFLSWSYDNRLMAQAILISFGISLVVRALIPSASREQHDITNA
ncbi:MAG: isoprenylcysteine carboxylmethyltransferase family protein [Terracidiphilus sp.]